MKCDRMAELLPDYLQEDLSHEQADQVEEHLELCAKCREEVALWRNLAMIPEEQPSPMLRARFTAMLDAYQHGQSEESGAGKHRAAWMDWMMGNWLRPAATSAVRGQPLTRTQASMITIQRISTPLSLTQPVKTMRQTARRSTQD